MVGFAVLCFVALPVGLSVVGCGHHSTPVQYCSAGDTGPVVGQVASIVLAPNFATSGESLNYGQMGSALSATAYDCKGNTVAVRGFSYASTSSFNENVPGGAIFADINPSSGQVCGGTWNRNVGGGIPNYTTCTAPPTTPNGFLAYVTATASGAVSNAIPVYVHPVVTGVELGTATTTIYPITGYKIGSSTTTFTTSTAPPAIGTFVTLGNFSQAALNGQTATVTAITSGSAGPPAILATFTVSKTFGQPSGDFVAQAGDAATNAGTDFCPNNTVGTGVTAPPYDGTSCLSQNATGQLVARIYQGGNTNAANDISCQVGHVSFAAQAANIVTIDETGVATARQPGSTVITATVSNSSTATQAGFFSTCPPASIKLSATGFAAGTDSIAVPVNTSQPLTATVVDTHGVAITGLALEFNSTTPQTIPPGVGSVTPLYPGSANITAVCLPSSCNTAPFSQIGYLGNGKPITSNPITVTAAGNSSTVIYMASTQSQYVAYRDFTTNQPSTLIKLPYVPNSMVITQNGTAIYFGSEQGLMTFTTSNNLLGATNQSISGVVLSISPDSSTLVVTDPVRQTISLITGGGSSVSTTWGGIGTHVSWSPDSQMVYITTTTGLVLSHSNYTDWQTATSGEVYSDVAVTAPAVGAFFAGPSFTDGRSYCPSSAIAATGNPPNVVNQFIPLADESAAVTDRLGVTTDGSHVLGAHADTTSGAVTLSDIDVVLPEDASTLNGACPTTISPGYFQSSFTTKTAAGIKATPTANNLGYTVATTAITGVIPASNSAAAFVTYNGMTTVGSSPLIPFYLPPASGAGTLRMLPLLFGASIQSAPVTGVFSTDDFNFYVGTSGEPVGASGTPADTTSADNDVHIFSLTYSSGSTPTAVDSGIIAPNLPLFSGTGYAPVNLLVQKPKKATD
jgi:hypothetical protein